LDHLLSGVRFARIRPEYRHEALLRLARLPHRSVRPTSAFYHRTARSGRPYGPTSANLASAVMWGILFRLPCARFIPGRAYDQRPPWARPVPTLERDYFGRLRGCVRVTHPSAGSG